MSPTQLIAMARKAMQQAYTPYSHFQVGAALLCADGTVFTGCNVENAAYGATICAERTAFVKAVSEGLRDFAAIAIVGGKDGIEAGPCAPCGTCRQVMQEFGDPDTFMIHLADGDVVQTYRLRELLPLGFAKANLDS